jgi:hypothetical protein
MFASGGREASAWVWAGSAPDRCGRRASSESEQNGKTTQSKISRFLPQPHTYNDIYLLQPTSQFEHLVRTTSLFFRDFGRRYPYCSSLLQTRFPKQIINTVTMVGYSDRATTPPRYRVPRPVRTDAAPSAQVSGLNARVSAREAGSTYLDTAPDEQIAQVPTGMATPYVSYQSEVLDRYAQPLLPSPFTSKYSDHANFLDSQLTRVLLNRYPLYCIHS